MHSQLCEHRGRGSEEGGRCCQPGEGDLLSQCREVAGSGPRWAAQAGSALGQAQAPQVPVLQGLCCSSTRKGPDEKQGTQWYCGMTMKGAPRTQGWLAAWLEARPTVLPCEAALAPGLAQRVGPVRVRPRPSQPTPPFLASPPRPEILGTSLQAASGYRLETGGGYKQRCGGGGGDEACGAQDAADDPQGAGGAEHKHSWAGPSSGSTRPALSRAQGPRREGLTQHRSRRRAADGPPGRSCRTPHRRSGLHPRPPQAWRSPLGSGDRTACSAHGKRDPNPRAVYITVCNGPRADSHGFHGPRGSELTSTSDFYVF